MVTARLEKSSCEVHSRRMAYIDIGWGQPVVFLHGNPASSYMWRKIIPHVAADCRCIAPDLIGMGDSEKLGDPDPDRYGFLAHRKFLDGFIEELALDGKVVLVGQDWGGALAMDWASRHADQASGIVYMETFVRPRTWEEMDPIVSEAMKRIRSSEGESLILEGNIFVEEMLPSRMLRKLTQEEMAEYRRPFLHPGEDRRPTLTWPRELAVGGEPEHMVEIIQAYGDWMARSEVPKLFINGDPGAILTGSLRELCRAWKNQEEVTVRGSHFLQEDSPDEIGIAILEWLRRVVL